MASRFPSKTFRAAATSAFCAEAAVAARSTIARMRMRTFYGAMLIVPLFAAAQKPLIPGLGETIEVSLVNIDVFVKDQSGKQVHGLTKDDFEVYENGLRQPITNFAEYTGET